MKLATFRFIPGAGDLWAPRKSHHQSSPRSLELFSCSREAGRGFTSGFREEVRDSLVLHRAILSTGLYH